MSKRSALGMVLGAVGCSLLLVCLCVALFAGYSYAALIITAFGSNRVDRIVYVDNQANIQITDARGEQRIALTTDASQSEMRFYMFPTWSPNSQLIAFISVSSTPLSREGRLLTVGARGGERVTVFKSATQFPFYLYWSPDSKRIGFLAQADNEMALMLGHADGKHDAQKLETGSPFYWAWSPDSQSLLMHVGGSHHDSNDARLAFLRWQEASAPKALTHQPSDFEAPQFSPEGSKIMYAGITESDEDALYVADMQDTNARVITKFDGRIAFAWSPDGKKIAWITTDIDSGLPNLGKVSVSDADGTHSRSITTEDALSFYWSPDSQQIAFLTLPLPNSTGCAFDCTHGPGLAAPLRQNQPVHLRWRAVDVASGQARTLATFVPTEDFVSLIPYFDQYARSLTFWSPDSKQFVYTQEDSNGEGGVWVRDVMTETPARQIAAGTLAVWSWK